MLQRRDSVLAEQIGRCVIDSFDDRNRQLVVIAFWCAKPIQRFGPHRADRPVVEKADEKEHAAAGVVRKNGVDADHAGDPADSNGGCRSQGARCHEPR